jgi:hypothetical protein
MRGEAALNGWTVPWPVASALAAAAGITRPYDPDHVATALAAWLPGGSAAKVDAMAEGRVPPGADTAACAEAILTGTVTAWSCWVHAGLAAALLSEAGIASTVTVLRRIDRASAPVDFHAVVTSETSRGPVLTDPFHGAGAMDLTNGSTTPARRLVTAELVPGVRPELAVCTAGGARLRYRLLGDVDPGDAAAFCELSTTHSGVTGPRSAHRIGATTAVRLNDLGDEPSRARVFRADGHEGRTTETRTFPDFETGIAWLSTQPVAP